MLAGNGHLNFATPTAPDRDGLAVRHHAAVTARIAGRLSRGRGGRVVRRRADRAELRRRAPAGAAGHRLQPARRRGGSPADRRQAAPRDHPVCGLDPLQPARCVGAGVHRGCGPPAWRLDAGIDEWSDAVAALFGAMEGAPITSLADVIAISNEDPANLAPYGQSFLELSVADELTPEEFAGVQATDAQLGETWMRTLLEQYDVDILVTGMLYSGNAGAAGIPALTIPNGLDPNGRPRGIILSGPYLSDPQLIAVGYALEQALNGRVAPDLDATIAQIDAVTGK